MSKKDVIDMDNLAEDPLAEVTKAAKSDKKRPAIVESTNIEAAKEQSKVPQRGYRPKRGCPYGSARIVNRSATFAAHHQKQLIIDLLDFLGGEAPVEKLVDMIESNESYWHRLKSMQPVYNCVVYHAKQLAEAGFLTLDQAPKAVKVQAKEQQPAPKEKQPTPKGTQEEKNEAFLAAKG